MAAGFSSSPTACSAGTPHRRRPDRDQATAITWSVQPHGSCVEWVSANRSDDDATVSTFPLDLSPDDGRRWVVETDIASCFEAIPHNKLMQTIEERVSDRHVLKLVRAMLSAGVMEHGSVSGSDSGTPQGGVISPLLANIYLNRVDRAWVDTGQGVLVRYADDLIVMCSTRHEAETALATLTVILADLGLTPKASKTRIVHLTVGGEGLDFLGFHHRWVQAKRARHVQFLARWPSDKAMQSCRDRIRELTARRRLFLSVEEIVGDLNRVLRRWATDFRYGNSAERFGQDQKLRP